MGERERVGIYLGLGSNLGDREARLREALERLADPIRVMAISGVYETEPVGFTDQPSFLNAVARVETPLEPAALLDACAAVESAMGRERRFPDAPRTIDIDLLLYGDTVMEGPGLTLPHPRMLDRAFVLAPLAELAPEMRHPRSGRTIRDHLDEVAAEGVERLFDGGRLLERSREAGSCDGC